MSYVIHVRRAKSLSRVKAATAIEALRKLRALRAVGASAHVFDASGEEVLEPELEDCIAREGAGSQA